MQTKQIQLPHSKTPITIKAWGYHDSHYDQTGAHRLKPANQRHIDETTQQIQNIDPQTEQEMLNTIKNGDSHPVARMVTADGDALAGIVITLA